MDTREASKQLTLARRTLESKGAPLEGTAAGHLILALESLVEHLDNTLGSTKKVTRKKTEYPNFGIKGPVN